ncbi:MAG: hypothetical protein EA361_00980, partial [Bacteroidetes bacterium]
MLPTSNSSNKLLTTLINASVGTFRQYQITFWSQLVLGSLYSFGFFDSRIAGFILGFVMPVMWVTLTYRYVFIKARQNVRLPFPDWMQKNPGNTLVIVIDTIFLALIWSMVLSGLYSATWVKVMFTIVFPILTLSMLRNLLIYPFAEKNDDENPPE